MKLLINKLFKPAATCLGIAAILLAFAPRAKAQNAYFDVNGATTGYGTATGGIYSWDTTNWGVSGGASATVAWTPGTFARFYGAGNYTVVATNSESVAGMYQDGGGVLTLTNNNGVGSLSIPTSATVLLTQNGFTWAPQGFLTAAGTLILTLPLTGPGGVEEESGGGYLEMYGTNTFSGGYVVSSSATYNLYNNNSSFGTGQILFDNTTFAIMQNSGPTTVNITNNCQTYLATGVNFIGNSVTFSGNWYLGGSTYAINLRNNGVGTTLTLAGVLSATSGTVNFSSANSSTILLQGHNTYTGATSIGVTGDAAITLEIASTGSIASTTITNDGTLKLDGASCLNTNASLQLLGSPVANSVNLNFTGTQSIAAIYLGGVPQPGGTYGSSTNSSVTYQVSWITGPGILSTPAKPAIAAQPTPQGALNGGTANFSVVATGASPLTYQWYSNSVAVSGANNSTFTVSPATTNGSYYVIVTNNVGSVTSSVVTLSIVESNAYTSAIVGDGAIAYYRLDETNGTTAYDVIGGYNGVYRNVTLGAPGFSLSDSDTAIALPGATSLPATGITNGYVIVSNTTAFRGFTGTGQTFSLEAWAQFTNFNVNASQRIISCLNISGNGYAFGIGSSTQLKFTQGAVADYVVTLTNALTTGQWYQFALTCDGSYYYFYLNGAQIGNPVATGIGNALTTSLNFGCNPTNYFLATSSPEANSEQVRGYLDEISIYNSTLSSGQVLNHYNARYGSLAAPVVSTPFISPATNYVSLSSTLTANAAGQYLTYQWYQGSTQLVGQTGSSLVLSPLALTNTGSYYVQVSNPVGTSNSPSVALTVVAIPTNAAQLNLTNALVLHLPFDGNYNDISGRNHNGTNIGSTTFVSPGAVGASALSYSTASGSTNYVTLGVVNDLQFGATTNFTVSFWVQQPPGSTFTNLPFFSDEIGSTAGTSGYSFAPYETASTAGGWQWSLSGASSPSVYTTFPDANLINDGNWHHMVFVANRSGNMTTYLDGNEVDAEAISFLGDVDTTNPATIGQDPTGAYPVNASAYIDDLAVWQRTLSSFEVSGIYLAGASNQVSFAPAISSGPTYELLTITNVSGALQLSWTGAANLQASTNVSGPYTNISGATSPYTVPTPLNSQNFYRLHP